MQLAEDVFLVAGAIAVFLFGLKKMSNEISEICGNRLTAFVRGATSNRVGALLSGCISTAILQSSIATNMIAITFVEKQVIDFYTCSAVIMGTNIGTTFTAQLVSLSSVFDFNMSAVASLICACGALLTLFNNKTLKSFGGASFAFGLVFIGLKLMTDAAENFKAYAWFNNLFLVKNPVVLLLNGFVITSFLQSSSVVTSIMVVLASLGLLDFSSAAFMIFGANIGTCLPVMLASAKMSEQSKKTALFNLIFNLFGCVLYFVPLIVFKDKIQKLSFFSNVYAGRNIANFHTLFNLTVSLALLPVLKPFCKLVEKIYKLLYSTNALKRVNQPHSTKNTSAVKSKYNSAQP